MSLYTFMYHGFDGEHPVSRLNVTITDFRAHLQTLKNYGFSSISHPSLLMSPEKDKKALITIDDGMKGSRKSAEVALEEGFIPYIFIIASRIGQDGYLTGAEITSMSKMGVAFGSHTHNLHNAGGSTICNSSAKDVQSDLERSVSEIASYTGVKPIAFAYPFGLCNDSILDVISTNFQYAFTTKPMWMGKSLKGIAKAVLHKTTPSFVPSDDCFHIPRVYVRDSMSPECIVRAADVPCYGTALKAYYSIRDRLI